MKKAWALILVLAIAALCATAGCAENTTDPGAFEPGAIVTFGTYEQDNDTGNGPEPIEWIVLDVQEGKALLLARYGLDVIPYNAESADVTWETCTLRKWLNSEFMSTAFSSEEQGAILLTDVDNSPAQGYSEWETFGGKDTKDQIFLLSYAEAHRYLNVNNWQDQDGINLKSRVQATDYAIARGAYRSDSSMTEDNVPAAYWLLRSPGYTNQKWVADVDVDGTLRNGQCDHVGACIRPALWINLESELFASPYWTCPECGKECSTAFCPWCGAKKPEPPAPPAPVVCPGCGAEYPADSGFMFCGECGTRLPGPAEETTEPSVPAEKTAEPIDPAEAIQGTWLLTDVTGEDTEIVAMYTDYLAAGLNATYTFRDGTATMRMLLFDDEINNTGVYRIRGNRFEIQTEDMEGPSTCEFLLEGDRLELHYSDYTQIFIRQAP